MILVVVACAVFKWYYIFCFWPEFEEYHDSINKKLPIMIDLSTGRAGEWLWRMISSILARE